MTIQHDFTILLNHYMDSGLNQQFLIFYVTAPTRSEAEHIARTLVEKKCAACISLVPQVDSFYWWKGVVEAAEEVMLIGKSTIDKKDEIIEVIRSVHSYEVPEIIFVPLFAGHEPYLKWIQDSIKR